MMMMTVASRLTGRLRLPGIRLHEIKFSFCSC